MSSTKIDFLYLNEEEMVKAGVTDMHRCVEVFPWYHDFFP